MDYNHFVNETKRILGDDMLQKDGAVLYTSYNTVQESDFYFLGLNPGANDDYSSDYQSKKLTDKSKIMNIEKSLNECVLQNYNEYEEPWKDTVASGQMRFQKNVKCLASNILHHDVNDMCCTNLIFRSTKDQSGINLQKEGDICWGVHEILLRTIKPKLIIACGNSNISSYYYLYSKLQGDKYKKVEPVDADHGRWKIKGFIGMFENRPTYVLGLPHLSRYTITSPKKHKLINDFLDSYIPKEYLDKWRSVQLPITI